MKRITENLTIRKVDDSLIFIYIIIFTVHKNEINDEEWDTLLSKNFSRESMAFFVRE
jgi:hypothetical protein